MKKNALEAAITHLQVAIESAKFAASVAQTLKGKLRFVKLQNELREHRRQLLLLHHSYEDALNIL